MVGAHGSLGRLITASPEADGAQTIAVDLRRSDPSERARLLRTLDTLVFSAPVVDAGSHREALQSGCHIVDVAVDRDLNAQLLALDQPAHGARRSVVAMAGFAPGLTDVLAADMLERFTPRAARLIVAVLQSPTGTAGDHGTREMLDPLTGANVTYRNRPVQSTEGTIAKVRLFDLRIPEPELSGLGTGFELATGFGQAFTHARFVPFGRCVPGSAWPTPGPRPCRAAQGPNTWNQRADTALGRRSRRCGPAGRGTAPDRLVGLHRDRGGRGGNRHHRRAWSTRTRRRPSTAVPHTRRPPDVAAHRGGHRRRHRSADSPDVELTEPRPA